MTDLISRQAAIDGADEIIKRDTSGNNAVVEAMKAWKLYIGSLPSAEPQWVPASERLPTESGIYLVTLKTDGVAYFEDEFPNGFVYVSTYDAVEMHWGYGDKNVIAWMPMSKPYEVEK